MTIMAAGGSVPADTEPCPHCNGTGTRLVPPPPKTRGGFQGHGRSHGYESTYCAGCRCELCRAAHREYRRNYERQRKSNADGSAA